MPSVGGIVREMSPVEKLHYRKCRRSANKATLFPMATDVLLIVGSIVFYILAAQPRQDEKHKTALLFSTGSKLIFFLLDFHVNKLIKRSSFRRVNQGYIIAGYLIVVRTLFTFTESAALAIIFLWAQQTTTFCIVAATIFMIIQLVYILALQVLQKLFIKPLNEFLSCFEDGCVIPAAVQLHPPANPTGPQESPPEFPKINPSCI